MQRSACTASLSRHSHLWTNSRFSGSMSFCAGLFGAGLGIRYSGTLVLRHLQHTGTSLVRFGLVGCISMQVQLTVTSDTSGNVEV
jgi:hypothetical protein